MSTKQWWRFLSFILVKAPAMSTNPKVEGNERKAAQIFRHNPFLFICTRNRKPFDSNLRICLNLSFRLSGAVIRLKSISLGVSLCFPARKLNNNARFLRLLSPSEWMEKWVDSFILMAYAFHVDITINKNSPDILSSPTVTFVRRSSVTWQDIQRKSRQILFGWAKESRK
jgi:hypothetical protein